MSTLVLGLGNTLLRDDGIAVRVIEELRRQTPDPEEMEFRTSALSGLALIDEILGFNRVIILDAVQSRTHDVGEVFPIQESELNRLAKGHSPHFVGLATLLHYCRSYGLEAPEKMQLLGIEVKDLFSFDERLSGELEEALPDITEKTKEWIKRF
jgi:hydrogenase maturation protease